jgi:hypothetical protein
VHIARLAAKIVFQFGLRSLFGCRLDDFPIALGDFNEGRFHVELNGHRLRKPSAVREAIGVAAYSLVEEAIASPSLFPWVIEEAAMQSGRKRALRSQLSSGSFADDRQAASPPISVDDSAGSRLPSPGQLRLRCVDRSTRLCGPKFTTPPSFVEFGFARP